MRAKNIRCPYCNKPAVYVSSAEVYEGINYGNIYLCRPCYAWVGVKAGTVEPLHCMVKHDRKKAA